MAFECCETRTLLTSGLLDAEGEGSGSGSACDYYGSVSVTIDPIADVNEGDGDDGDSSGSGSAYRIVPMSGTASSDVSVVAIYVEGDLVGHAPVANGVWHTKYPYSYPTTDDNPSGTPSDVKQVEVTGGPLPECTASATSSFTLHNVAPTLALAVPPDGVWENAAGAFTFTLSDPALADTFNLVVDWGDGHTETYNPTQGQFTLHHTYLDDNPTDTPQDDYTITATVTDDDTGTTTLTAQVTVKNVAPTLELNQPAVLYFGKEGLVSVSGTLADQGPLDMHTLTVDWGDGSPDDVYAPGAEGGFSFALDHAYLDDENPASVYTITVTATDDDGGTATGTLFAKEVGVIGWTVERLNVDENWVAVPDEEWASADDQFRWTATISPSEPEITIVAVEWWATPWEGHDNPGAVWTQFAASSGDAPVVSDGLGPGIWAVLPRARFLDHQEFVQVTADPEPREHREARIIDVTFYGVDPGDGQTNLSGDNPGETGEGYNMGAGWRFFYGRNTPNGPLHERVGIRIAVTPNEPDIPVYMKLTDADDPTDADGPIDADPNAGDNIIVPPLAYASRNTLPSQGANALVEFAQVFSPKPGDNFRVIAGLRPDRFERILPRASSTEPETRGRAYFDQNTNGSHDATEHVLENVVAITGNRFVSSPLLTIWRRLYVEIDSMGAPVDGQEYGFDAHDPHPGGPIQRPNPDGLEAAFRKAFVAVEVLTDPNVSQSDLEFRRFLTDQEQHDYFVGNDRSRQTPRSEEYWSVYVAGVYEFSLETLAGMDNDPNEEIAWLGVTNISTGGTYSLIPMEIIRDVASEYYPGRAAWTVEQVTAFQRLIVIHEIGHQFELDHADPFPDHAMAVPDGPDAEQEEALAYTQVPKYRDEDIRSIRRFTFSVWPDL